MLDRAGSGFFRWLTTDHNRNLSALIAPPSDSFLATLSHTLKCLLLSICFTVARTLLLIVLYALWIPCLLFAIRWILLN